jgi:hypothetical protein
MLSALMPCCGLDFAALLQREPLHRSMAAPDVKKEAPLTLGKQSTSREGHEKPAQDPNEDRVVLEMIGSTDAVLGGLHDGHCAEVRTNSAEESWHVQGGSSHFFPAPSAPPARAHGDCQGPRPQQARREVRALSA